LEVLRGLEAGSVDAVVTDPPYNVGLDYCGYDDKRSDYAEWCASWFAELRRVCRGPIAITCGQANVAVWARIEAPDWWLAWWKPAAMGRCVVGFNNWEPIALYGAPPKPACDVIRAEIRPEKAIDGHPCPKPLDWAAKQVRMLTTPGASVLDPFMGSGTTGVACFQSGRDFIGIEREESYYKIAERRIATAQPPLPMAAD
jgi:site-specific DNA-methyltransferase (adenine-specific)